MYVYMSLSLYVYVHVYVPHAHRGQDQGAEYAYVYLHALTNESFIALRALCDGPYGFSFELSFTILVSGLGLNLIISSAVNVDGANKIPPIPKDDFNQSLLDCIVFNLNHKV